MSYAKPSNIRVAVHATRQNHQLLAGESLVFISGVGWWHGIVFVYLLAQVVEVADVESSMWDPLELLPILSFKGT